MNDYYNNLWNYVYNAKCGSHELKPMSEEQKNKFDEIIKDWISKDEFQVFNFYLEYSNDFTQLLKKEYPFNRMEYLENTALKNTPSPLN